MIKSIQLTVLLFLCMAAIGLTETVTPSRVTLQNQQTRFDFDLSTGTYSVTILPGNALAIGNAHATVENWASTDSLCQRNVVDRSPDRLVVQCARPDGPTLMLEFQLHSEFVELRTGLKNTTHAPLRIKTFQPLTSGVVFPGESWSDLRTLNAPSGANQTKVADAVCASANNLLLTFKQSGIRRSVVLGALKTADFTKWAKVAADAVLPTAVPGERTASIGSGPVAAALEARDPIGKLVEPGETYFPEDSFYLDAGTSNPFEALEKYGRQLREATGARPNPYDFPTVCAWYAGVWKTSGAQDHPEKSAYKINTSSGLVEEARKMEESGFLGYSRAAGRLVPDNYTANNPQGWWDDEHWRLHGLYTEPYGSSAAFGDGMHSQGVLAFTYIQPFSWMKTPLSRDFREQHTGWLCARDLNRSLDCSQPEVQAYLRGKFGALRGHIDGLMVDYCDEFWTKEVSRGGFDDAHMTATAFYRQFFRCVKDGLGPNSWLHERNVGAPNNDLTLGIVDSQRTAGDTDKISPELVSRSGLRWYKNRVAMGYDMDSKDLTSAWKIKGWSGTDQDGRRMLLTMAYVGASRLLLANSFRTLTPEVLRDLERVFPYPTEPRSARPVDAFTCSGWPRVYDYAVTPDWHQVTLFNNALPTREESLSVPLSGENADGALGLDSKGDYYVYDFWNDCFVGRIKGTESLRQTVRPGEARMLSIRKVEPHPQVLSTNRHLMQGCLDLADVKWDGHRLTGKARVIGGEPFRIVLALNGRTPENLKACNDGRLTTFELERPRNETVEWSIGFK